MPDIFVDPDSIPQIRETPPQDLPSNNGRRLHKPPAPSKKKEVGTLETFREYPLGLTFQHQEKDEEIILFLRQHLITNIPWIIISALLLLAPLVFIPFLEVMQIFPFELSGATIIVLLLFYYLIIFAYGFISFLGWFYNIGLVTDKRVIDLDYDSIVRVHVSATKVLQIQDVSYTQSGFLRTLFNYGDVRVQTAGQHPDFEFLRIPNPSKATFIIQKMIGLA